MQNEKIISLSHITLLLPAIKCSIRMIFNSAWTAGKHHSMRCKTDKQGCTLQVTPKNN
jgi:hypothetical protein